LKKNHVPVVNPASFPQARANSSSPRAALLPPGPGWPVLRAPGSWQSLVTGTGRLVHGPGMAGTRRPASSPASAGEKRLLVSNDYASDTSRHSRGVARQFGWLLRSQTVSATFSLVTLRCVLAEVFPYRHHLLGEGCSRATAGEHESAGETSGRIECASAHERRLPSVQLRASCRGPTALGVP